jgi:hypothetical protein
MILIVSEPIIINVNGIIYLTIVLKENKILDFINPKYNPNA